MKNTIRFLICTIVVFVLYTLLIFIMPFDHFAIFWVSYLFTIIAFAVAIAACAIAFKKGASSKSRFYGFPVARVGINYLIIQAILSIVFMALSWYAPIWIGLSLYIVALGVAVIGLVATDAVRDHIETQNTRLDENVYIIRSAQSKLNQLAIVCSSSDVAGAVTKFAEELRYSDPVSSSGLNVIEAELVATIDELERAIIEENAVTALELCRLGQKQLIERNRICKLNKSH